MEKIEHKLIDLASFKMSDDGPGELTGYASEFGILDDGGDIALPGAFAETREKYLRAGFTAHSHDWSYDGVIGFPVEATEDSNGFLIKSRFHSTPDAQNIRIKAKERMDAGKDVKLSIGYQATAVAYINATDYKSELPKYVRADTLADALKKAYTFPRVRLLKTIELFEHSIVTVPMLESAQATSVKAMKENTGAKADFSLHLAMDAKTLTVGDLTSPFTLGESYTFPTKDGSTARIVFTAAPSKSIEPVDVKGAFEDELADRNNNPWVFWDVFCCLLYNMLWLAELSEDVAGAATVDLVPKFDEISAEFLARMREWFIAEVSEEMTEGPDDIVAEELAYAGLLSLGEKKSRFGDFSEKLLSALDAYVARAKDVAAWKASNKNGRKEGRQIGAVNRERMKAAMEKIKSAMEHMQTVHDDMETLVAASEPKEDPKGMPAEEAQRLLAGILKERFEINEILNPASNV